MNSYIVLNIGLFCGHLLFLYHRLVIKQDFIFILYFRIYFSYLLLLLSLILVEWTSPYVHEVERVIYPNGASLIFNLFILITYWCNIRVKIVNTEYPSNEFKGVSSRVFLYIYGSFLIYSLLYLGSLDFFASTKLGYFRRTLTGSFGLFFQLISLIMSFIAQYYIMLSKRKEFLYVSILYILNLLINNALATILQNYLYFVFIRYSIFDKELPSFKTTIGLITFLLSGLYFRALVMNGNAAGNLFNTINRISSQGQLFWYSIDHRFNGDGIGMLQSFLSNILSIRNKGLVYEYGLGAFMYDVSPNIAPTFIENFVSFAGGSPAIYIYYFGLFIGSILFCALMLVFNLFIKEYIMMIKYRDVIGFIIISYLGNYVYNLVVNGNYTDINLRLLILLIIYSIYKKSYGKKKYHYSI